MICILRSLIRCLTCIITDVVISDGIQSSVILQLLQALKDRKWLQRGALILSVLIILSTMFIKQHSVIDVCLGTTLALFGHLLFYPQRVDDYEEQRSLSHMRKKKPEQNL